MLGVTTYEGDERKGCFGGNDTYVSDERKGAGRKGTGYLNIF